MKLLGLGLLTFLFSMGPAFSQTVTLTIPNGNTVQSNWGPSVYNFNDPVPAGNVITGVDMRWDARDQGWGGTNGWATVTINDSRIGASQIWGNHSGYYTDYTFRHYEFSFDGCLPDYNYGGSNQWRAYFYGYGGWQLFYMNASMTIHYAAREYQPPVFSQCPSAIVVMAEKDATSAPAFWVAPIATDNMSVCSLTSNYEPNDVFPIGTTEVVYTAMDPSGNTAQCRFQVTVLESATPTALDDEFGVCANGSITFTAADLLGNDSDPQGDPLKIDEITAASNGNLVRNTDGSYTYTPNPGFSGMEVFQYVIKKDDGYTAFPENNHYYEFVPANGITWTNARYAASTRYYQGMQGYLVTVTSAGENAFVASKLQGQGWLGASDETGEGIWRWATGPEAGIHFSNQFKYGWCNAITAPGINGNYANWAGGEPNDCSRGEDYAHFLSNGTWNDYPNYVGDNIRGYVVEYGGLEATLPLLTATASIIVDVHPSPVITLDAVNIDCFGSQNGSVSASISEGTAPFFYNWSNGATSPDISALAPGQYILTVTDSKGCQAQASATITEPTQLVSELTAPNVLCYGGTILKTNHVVSGGTEPYTYLWSNGSTDLDLSEIPAGSYSVAVTDANGCTAYSQVEVTQPAAPIEIQGQTSDYNGFSVSCYASANGSIDLLVTGGTPGYAFDWSDGNSGKDRTNLGAGFYTVVVTDANGCSAELSFELTEPDPLSSDPIDGAMVFLGYGPSESATLTGNPASGGVAPYTYEWYDMDGNLMATGFEGTFSPKETSVYNFIITDANGCQLIVEGTICAVDISCTAGNGKGKGNSGNKVSVCHIPDGNPSNQHTICVSVNAVASHLAEGDLLGPCGTPQVCDGSFKSGSLDANPGVFSSDFVFSLYPNPAQDYANVVFNVDANSRLQVTLNDLSGKVLETIYDGSAVAGQEYQSQIDLNNVPQGVYLVRMVSDRGLLSVLRLTVL